ncbi:MAG: hypothetical protein F6K10_17425 [Moorea sp. SIO2B7]|nr:hypothetical protein [Moorena sp. SIO2B7]
MKSMRFKFSVEVYNQEYVIQRWDEIEIAIRRSFESSTFSKELSLEMVLDDTLHGYPKPLDGSLRPVVKNVKNIIAFDKNDKIIGGIFSISTSICEDEIQAVIGWFFTLPELSNIHRVRVADALVKRVHQEMYQAGCQRIVTEMGTQAGASYLQKRFGYVHSPKPGKSNRWIFDLSTMS